MWLKWHQELKLEMMMMEQEQQKWRKHSAQQHAALNEAKMTADQSKKHMTEVAMNRSEQLTRLTKAVTYRAEG